MINECVIFSVIFILYSEYSAHHLNPTFLCGEKKTENDDLTDEKTRKVETHAYR